MRLRSDRRRFLAGTASLASFAVLGCKTTNASSSQASRNATALNVRSSIFSAQGKKDLANYREAVRLLKQTPAWEAQANIHNDFCTHNNWFFLPWHRFYLHYFEQLLRKTLRDAKITATFNLPYWDWTQGEHRIPTEFWDTGSSLYDDRSITASDSIEEAMVGTRMIREILAVNNFTTFAGGRVLGQRDDNRAGMLEGNPHNTVHSTIGGDMGTFLSPRDPIFWLHHANVDRMWAEWASKNPRAVLPAVPNPNDDDGVADDGTVLDATYWRNFTLSGYQDLNGSQVTRQVKETLTTQGMPVPYTYDTLAGNAGLGLADSEAAATAAVRTDKVFATVSMPGTELVVDRVAMTVNAAINYTPEVSNGLQKIVSGNDVDHSLTLYVDHVPVPEDQQNSIYIFVYFPEITRAAGADDPHYVTALSFFSHPHGSKTGKSEAAFAVDLTRVVKRLADAGVDVTKALTVQTIVSNSDIHTALLMPKAFFDPIKLTVVYKEN